MALRDQPYIPLYVQDYLTDEKLNRCSWSTQGIYMKVLCVLHKQKEYGCILLQQIDKQNPSNIYNFAKVLADSIPSKEPNDIYNAVDELVKREVLFIENDKLFQARMINDNAISESRKEAGSKGGFATAKRTAKTKQNPEYEYEYESENKVLIKKEDNIPYDEIVAYLNLKAGTKYKPSAGNTKQLIHARWEEGFLLEDFKRCIDNKCIDWLNDRDMVKYLRPDTLFSKSKFQGYVNQQRTAGDKLGINNQAAKILQDGMKAFNLADDFNAKPEAKIGEIINVE